MVNLGDTFEKGLVLKVEKNWDQDYQHSEL